MLGLCCTSKLSLHVSGCMGVEISPRSSSDLAKMSGPLDKARTVRCGGEKLPCFGSGSEVVAASSESSAHSHFVC